MIQKSSADLRKQMSVVVDWVSANGSAFSLHERRTIVGSLLG